MDGQKIFPIKEGRLPTVTTNKDEDEREQNIRELATHIVTSAPSEIVEEFSIGFLMQTFKSDPESFDNTWEKYKEQQLEQNSKIIKFPVKK